MTTQEKTTAIKNVVTNHHDNVIAVQNAQVTAGLSALVIEAMNTAFKNDLTIIFASSKPAAPGGRIGKERAYARSFATANGAVRMRATQMGSEPDWH